MGNLWKPVFELVKKLEINDDRRFFTCYTMMLSKVDGPVMDKAYSRNVCSLLWKLSCPIPFAHCRYLLYSVVLMSNQALRKSTHKLWAPQNILSCDVLITTLEFYSSLSELDKKRDCVPQIFCCLELVQGFIRDQSPIKVLNNSSFVECSLKPCALFTKWIGLFRV